MPVITFKYQDLKDLGIDMEKDELINTLPMMSSDIEDFDDERNQSGIFPKSSGQFICRRSCQYSLKALSIRKQDFQNTKLHNQMKV